MSPPAIAPATSTAPIETHQRIAALPSSELIVTRKPLSAKREHGLSLHIQVRQTAGFPAGRETVFSSGKRENVRRCRRNDRRHHQAENQGSDQDRTAATAQ